MIHKKCPVCLTDAEKHRKGDITIVMLDGKIVNLEQYLTIRKETTA